MHFFSTANFLANRPVQIQSTAHGRDFRWPALRPSHCIYTAAHHYTNICTAAAKMHSVQSSNQSQDIGPMQGIQTHDSFLAPQINDVCLHIKMQGLLVSAASWIAHTSTSSGTGTLPPTFRPCLSRWIADQPVVFHRDASYFDTFSGPAHHNKLCGAVWLKHAPRTCAPNDAYLFVTVYRSYCLLQRIWTAVDA